MAKVRVKVYGLVSLTKRTYLLVQGLALALVLLVVALGFGLPRPAPVPGEELPPFSATLGAVLDWLPWLAILLLIAGVVETCLVLGKFARKEAERSPGADAPGSPKLDVQVKSMAFFPEVDKIRYEGPQSTNPLSFRHYNADEVIAGKPMREHFRFAVAYWHTMRNQGGDPFGPGCAVRPWEDGSDSVEMALKRVRVAFEFMEKLGVPFYCFHDRDVAPEGANLRETNTNLDKVVKALKEEQQRTGIKLLWGTANLFSNRRYVHGASTSPNADVFAYAAAQVKKALEVTRELGGVNYVFWGGREGYVNLYNTDMKRELDHLARFFHLAVDYKKKIGFGGQFLIEPKPKEPTSHQYDFDAAACINFLRAYNLTGDFKLNLETNHATLAGHTMLHEMVYTAAQGLLGSVDANRGDLLLGWDTDQFPTDLYLTTGIMLVVLEQGGLAPGGLNFDAKVRRESFEPVDLFHAHIGGMDAFARGLKIAAKIQADGILKDFVKKRYASWDSGIGQQVEAGKATFEDLEKYMLDKGDAARNVSGRQEMLENLINRYVETA